MRFDGIEVQSVLSKRQTAFFLMDAGVARQARTLVRDCRSSGYPVCGITLEWTDYKDDGRQPGTQFVHVKVDCEGRKHMAGFVEAYCPGCRTVYPPTTPHPDVRCKLRQALDVMEE